uniref:AfsR/SARP family transcriptional regulator n=1 Tax=Nonomuraea pusilla TaxID=46177 RepID=UPI0006E1CC88|nr:BTAD domain-containing putative transcriptional regulator [Nonomuraea pusilla]
MRFVLLGPLEARRTDGSVMATGGPRLRALLAMLLLDAGRVVTAERLIDGLYGERGGAANALQSQVSRLRKGLGPDAPVEFHPAGYRLALDPSEVDALLFERLAAEGKAAASPGERAAVLGRALALWRGPALADLRDAPFAAAQAARLDELRLDAVEARIEAELELGLHGDVVPELRDLVAAHPLRERLRGQLMRALYAGGRQGEALAAYESGRALLAEELGVDPSPELAATHLALLRGTLPPPPAPRTRATGQTPAIPETREAWQTPATPETRAVPETPVPSRTRPAPAPPAQQAPAVVAMIPAQLTGFVGREADLAALAGLLERARLVTLIGPGGAGKTRLAVEACLASPRAEPARPTGPGGERETCFVALGPLGHGDEVARAVLAALGLREGPLEPSQARTAPAGPVDRLVAALSGRSLLLVLDNCEHVVEATAALAHRLLASCPGLRVLATSREALGITGETLFPVSPLALPEAGAPPLSAPAVRLFAERAAAVRPGFAVDDGNAADVLRVCRALDGLPLAIELAAARLRALPVAELAARLDDAFALLSRGSRTAEPRHRTLRAVVEWSWDLLDEEERTLARRLSVFAGGATLEAVERVCRVPDTVGVLAGLADKSLVEVAGDRYRMLRTIQAFCVERLAEAGEEERLRRAHAEHALGLLRAAAPHLLGAGQLDRLATLDAEQDDLRAALRWAVAADPALGLRLLADLVTYWWLRGRRPEAVAPARALLAEVGTRPPDGLAAEYVLCVVSAALPAEEAAPHLERAAELMLAADLVEERPPLLIFWSVLTGPVNAELREVLSERVRASTHPWAAAMSHLGAGVLAQFLGGDMDLAERECLLAAERFRAVGERWGMMAATSELADLAGLTGRRERFAELMDESLRLADELGAVDDRAELLCRRADGVLLMGDAEAAESGYAQALELAARLGSASAVERARYGLAEVARRRGDHGRARAAYEELLAAGDGSFGSGLTAVQARTGLGRIAAAEGDAEEAAARQREALATALDLRSRPHAAGAMEGLAGVAALRGDHERAALLLGAARALRGIPRVGDPDVAAVEDAARARLGGERYARAHAEGARLTREEALALAAGTS